MTRQSRPVFLNLMQIQMPVGALTSIGHRITGVLLAVGVPLSLYLLYPQCLIGYRFSLRARRVGRFPPLMAMIASDR
jgi:succinate dehydrogenase cytochrome b556 subunit